MWRSVEALGTPTALTNAISLLFTTATVQTKIPLNMSVITTFLKTKTWIYIIKRNIFISSLRQVQFLDFHDFFKSLNFRNSDHGKTHL